MKNKKKSSNGAGKLVSVGTFLGILQILLDKPDAVVKITEAVVKAIEHLT